MDAVVYRGPNDVAIQDIPRPRIEEPTDIILKLTSSAICGSDLHMYDGHSTAKPGMVFGHEPIGIVDEVGPAVRLVAEGDRVVVPFNVACGKCLNCIKGLTNACLTMNPKQPGAAYGYVEMGPYQGAQAEYVRIPDADWACLKLPGEAFDEFEDDFLLLADIFPTGYHATELAHVQSGDSVAIFGAGPVGLLAAHSAIIKGASEVYVVDKSATRLALAKRAGAIPIDFTQGDPVQQIIEYRRKNRMLADSLRDGESKVLDGVDCGIDAVGYQAFDRGNPNEFNPNQVLSDLARVVRATGHIGVIGVYLDQDPAAKDEAQKAGMLTIPFGEMWTKGITIGTGQTPVKLYHEQLRDLIIAGKAKPSFIVSDSISINDAPKYYQEFDKRDKVTKAIIRFEGAK
jgi:glutathione-independent formaldehyde dehydrogenase